MAESTVYLWYSLRPTWIVSGTGKAIFRHCSRSFLDRSLNNGIIPLTVSSLRSVSTLVAFAACTCICTWKQWRLQKVNSKNSSTWAAMPLWWLLMCEPMPELVHSLGLHPSLPRRTILSQCRHFASRKSSDSESKLGKINLICLTFILPKVCPPWTRSFPSCRHWLKLWLFDSLCKNHKAIICILVKKNFQKLLSSQPACRLLRRPPGHLVWAFGANCASLPSGNS